MAVLPISLARVSQNLRAFNLLETVRASQVGLFRSQNQLATGLRFQAPSEDPVRAAASGRLDRRLDTLATVQSNLRDTTAVLRSGESAAQDAVDAIREARRLATEAVNDTIAADERESLAIVVNSLLDQTIAVGNRKHLDRYLFAGLYDGQPPFELMPDGVHYRGDATAATAIVDEDLSQDAFTLPGAAFFAAVSSEVRGIEDLNPTITPETRLTDLRGTTGLGIRLGAIVVSDGSSQAQIDLTAADTVGDVLDLLNAQMPATLQASLDTFGINVGSIAGGPPMAIMITDVGGGQAARDLGISTADGSPLASVSGGDLNPRLTPRTRLIDLRGGLGVSLVGGLTIHNGNQTATIDFAGAETLEDVLNRINHAGAGVWAKIGEDGETIQILNRISGADLRIEENGGQAATQLGVRSLHGGTRLSELHDGSGVETIDGVDFRITTRAGVEVDIDLDDLNLTSATTLQDVIDLINARAAGAVTASLAQSGNGIRIVDNTIGSGVLKIERINHSPAIDGLGLAVDALGGTLQGQDVNPIRVDGPFTALLELRDSLQADDRTGIVRAAERLERTLAAMQEQQGRLASLAAQMEGRAERVESEVSATRIMQSDVRDVDVAEAVVRFQQLQTALQANLSTAARVLDLSLLNFLR